jgi:hypothetical protein
MLASVIIIIIVLIIIIYFYKKSKSYDSSDIEFTFSVKNLNKKELANLKENHSVNFWQKPNTYTVFIYRAGTMGGRGRIGIVPNKYSRQIVNDLQHDRTYGGEIVSLNSSDVIIRYTRPSSQRMKKIQKRFNDERGEKLKQFLNKSNHPRKDLSISVSPDY